MMCRRFRAIPSYTSVRRGSYHWNWIFTIEAEKILFIVFPDVVRLFSLPLDARWFSQLESSKYPREKTFGKLHFHSQPVSSSSGENCLREDGKLFSWCLHIFFIFDGSCRFIVNSNKFVENVQSFRSAGGAILGSLWENIPSIST